MSARMERNMGNEDKVTKSDLVKQSKSHFLPEEIQDYESGAETYSLEEEFAKSRKNRNILLYLFIVLFSAAALALTFFFTDWFQEKETSEDVAISEFEDVRLKELMRKMRKRGTNVDLKRIEVSQLEVDMRRKMLAVQEDYYRRRTRLIEENLGSDDLKSRLDALDKAEERNLRGVRAQYAGEIAARRAEIKKIEEERRKANEELEKSGDSPVMSNEERVYELNMKKMRSEQNSTTEDMHRYYRGYVQYLIKKYNPVYSSPELKSILQENYGSHDLAQLPPYDELLGREGIMSREDFNSRRDHVKDQALLIERMRMIPYTNSIAPTLVDMKGLHESIVTDYEKTVTRLLQRIRKKNSQIANYHFAFDSYLKTKPESGYIIDSRETSRMKVHINRVHSFSNNTTALVFRDDDEYIGKVALFVEGGEQLARLVESAPGKTVRPFDKIILKITKQ